MRILTTTLIIALLMIGCDGGDSSTEGDPKDTVSGDAAVTPDTTLNEDTTSPLDITEAPDLPEGQDTITAQDTPPAEDTVQPEDTTPPGELSCSGVIECVIGCDENPDCYEDCIALGTEEAQDLFWGLMDCIFEECGEEPTPDCMEQVQEEGAACYDELTTCHGGELPQGGTCMDIDACADLCEGDALYCLNACLGEGDPDAQQMYQDLINCVLDVCAEDPTPACQDSALENACNDELQACQNDT
jgi:hypothetical protein